MLAIETRITVAAVADSGEERTAQIAGCDIDGFCDAVLERIFDDFTTVASGCFAQGFCAAIDAMGSCTIDFADPAGTVRQAWADVTDITGARPKVTAIMECLPPAMGARR